MKEQDQQVNIKMSVSKKKINVGLLVRGLTKGGVTRYIRNLLAEFEAINNPQIKIFLFTDDICFVEEFKNIKVIYIKNINKIYWDYIKIVPHILKEQINTIIYPKNIIPITHIFLKAKKINIVHDLAHFDKNINAYPFWDTFYMKIFMTLSCQIADKTIAVSKYTKQDIVNRLGIDPKNITVIHEGVERAFKKMTDQNGLSEVIKKFNLKIPFLFYCGSLSPRKNIIGVLKAFCAIKNIIPHNLYLAGDIFKFGKNSGVQKLLDEDHENRIFCLGYVTEEELIALYSMADMYIYPSLYEGFGLPIIESQACGCPVLTSNVTSCPEVAGDGAMIVNPYSTDEIANAMLNILSDKSLSDSLKEKGFENIKRFSWKESAKEMLKIVKIGNSQFKRAKTHGLQ